MKVRLTKHFGIVGLTAETVKHLTSITEDYFARTNDHHSRVWIFNPAERSHFLRSSVQFSDGKFSVYIADPFSGLQPVLLSYQSFREDIQIGFRPTVILDSNLVSYLHHYVTRSSFLNAGQRETVTAFLKFVISNKLDYNPFFYYVEGRAKNEELTLLNYAKETSHSILTLHTMKVESFLKTGEIVADPALLGLYAEEYGVERLEDMAPLHAQAMIRRVDEHLDSLSKLIYATLLRIGLIHKTRDVGIVAKFEELMHFMQDELNIAMGFERMLALGYFAGKFDGFIPMQRGAATTKLFRRLKAAAWDLVLLRLPAQMLAFGSNTDISVGYICTSDRALWQVARTAKLESVSIITPDFSKGIPVHTYDPGPLNLNISNETLMTILAADTEWQKARVPNLPSAENRISYERMLALINELEEEVAEFCSAL